jgi:hypothetical protein
MTGTILKPQKTYFFNELEELNFTQTSLFLLNYINLFKSIENNFSTLTYLVNQNLVNSYLVNKDVSYNYKDNVIYLVFSKEGIYKPNVSANGKIFTILELLEEKSETLDYYEDNFNHIYTFKPNNQVFQEAVYFLKRGMYLSLNKLTSKDTVSTFVNNILDKKGLYEIIQKELDIDYVPYPYLKLSKEKESYSEQNFKKICYKDFHLLKKFI